MRYAKWTMVAVAVVLALAPIIHAETVGTCSIGPERDADRASGLSRAEYVRFEWKTDDRSREHRGDGNTDKHWERWTGISAADLGRDGAALDARMKSDAGEMRCAGTVQGGELHGRLSFTPNAEFVRTMEGLGFSGLNDDKLRGYAMLNVTLNWVRQLKSAGVEGLTTDKLMGLRALGVTSEYVQGMKQAGYPELRADKLTSMKAVGVSPEKVAAVRAMGLQPTEDELVQMSVFHIDADFVAKMKAHGFAHPTIAQLVQIKVFKLDE